MRPARKRYLEIEAPRNPRKFFKLRVALSLLAFIALTFTFPRGNAVDPFTLNNPGTTNNLESLIGTFPRTLENERERSDPSDLYRAPGEPIINEWFKVDGTYRGFLSVSSFSRFALMPSFLGSKQTIDTKDLSNVYSYNANLPPCFDVNQTDCIFDFSLIADDQTVLKAEPYSALPKVTYYPNVLWDYKYAPGDSPFGTFKGNRNLNLPSGGDLWIWNVPKLKSGKTSLYSASVLLESGRDPLSTSRFANPETKLQISPVEVDLPICKLPRDRDGCAWRDYQTGLDGAIFESDQLSIKRSANDFTGKYRLGFKLSVPWTSWLISTVSGVDIKSSRQGDNYIYEVSGNPSTIPTIRRFIPINENYWTTFGNLIDSNQCPTRAPDCSPIISLGKWNINDKAFETIEAAERLIGTKASYMTKTWAIMSSSLATYSDPKSANTDLAICSEKFAKDQPSGITGSNATLFEHSPPTWDKNLKSFSYKVGAFKKTPEGTDFLGDYSLLVSSDVARCLWGADASSAKATLQVVNSGGEAQVATTLVSSDSKWFRFRVSGFHFSSPKIVASIAKSAQPKSTTITCTKGKISKKVTAINPKCPAGYKKT